MNKFVKVNKWIFWISALLIPVFFLVVRQSVDFIAYSTLGAIIILVKSSLGIQTLLIITLVSGIADLGFKYKKYRYNAKS
jgi:hypothetical protein